jgi:hypothetical protein
MSIERKCLICGTPFTTYPSLNKRYCGRECFHISKRKAKLDSRYRYLHIGKEGHPLAPPNSAIHEHRVLLYDKIGPGAHPCHHCGATVTWMTSAGTTAGALVSDHLDRNPKNNNPENLVPSCQRCNILNSDRIVRDEENYRVISKGTRVRGERRTCATCGGSFVAWPSTAGRQRREGIYCSKACMYARPR